MLRVKLMIQVLKHREGAFRDREGGVQKLSDLHSHSFPKPSLEAGS